MANSGPKYQYSQFYINQNKDDISSKLPTDRFPAKIIDAYKMVGILDGGNYTVFKQANDGMDEDKLRLPKLMIRTNQNKTSRLKIEILKIHTS